MGVLTKKPERVDEIVSAVPRELGLLIHRLLTKKAGLRPASADALAREVEELQRSLTLRKLRVTHRGPSRDPIAAWGLSAH
jgi:hypothetical protein